MSISGERELELEREQMERVRLTQVRDECRALADACDAEIRQVRDVAVQQLAAAALQQVAAGLALARGELPERPDAALGRLGQLQTALHRAIADGEARARTWSEEQVRFVADTRVAVQRAAAVGGDTGPAARARALAEAGDLVAAREALVAADSAAANARSANLDERVRREVVRGILHSLRDLGFVSAGPQLDAGVVVLEGRLATGRRAVFEVHLDGRLCFDLDGYEGRACAEDLARVDTILRDRFGVQLGPPQVVWKNPDRLTQGALHGPASGTHKKA
ncbi:MAG TPA: hypothetical protein VGB85_03765 [Nannocystis sp.]